MGAKDWRVRKLMEMGKRRKCWNKVAKIWLKFGKKKYFVHFFFS